MPRRFLRNHYPGQSLVEFALVLPFLILILMGTLDTGWMIYTNNALSNAAREGARVGITGKTDTEIKTRVKSTAVGVSLTDSNITITHATPFGQPGTVTVEIAYSYSPLTPVLGNMFGSGGTFTLRAKATMRVEG